MGPMPLVEKSVQVESYTQIIYASYVGEEIKRIEADIKSAEQLATSDPGSARRSCYAIENAISEANVLADAAIAEFHLKEVKRVQAQHAERQKLLDVYYKIIGTIQDPVVASMAHAELSILVKDINDNSKHFTATDVRSKIALFIRYNPDVR